MGYGIELASKIKKENKYIMESNNFQTIFNIISDYLPKKWDKVAMYFLCSGNMFISKFYVDMGNGFVDCYNLGYQRPVLGRIFRSLEAVLIKERTELPPKNVWSVFTMLVDSNGKFEADYEYEDVSETFIEHQKKWEEKHIKKR